MRLDTKSFFLKKDKEKKDLFPVGMICFKGFQGSGKTLTMVKKCFDIKKAFPNCKIYSNMFLFGVDYELFRSNTDLLNCLKQNNGTDGIIFLIDEAHLYFNKKNGIPLEVMQQLCLNRKNRRLCLMTWQIWEDVDPMLRKQIKTVVNCRRVWNLQINTYTNGEQLRYDKKESEFVAPKLYVEIFKHNNLYYSRYDTYEVIETNKEYDRTITAARGAPPAQLIDIKVKKGF